MRKSIATITLISIILVIWTNFELLPLISCNCNSSRVNTIISDLSLATISASIFYFIDIYLKEVLEFRKVKPKLMIHYNAILGISNNLKYELEATLGEKLKINESKLDDFILQLMRIPLDSIYTRNRIVDVTWENYLKEVALHTREQIDRILVFSKSIDLDTILLLTSIYDCSFFNISLTVAPINIIQSKMGTGLNHNNLHSLHLTIVEYYDLIKKLKKKQKLAFDLI